MVDVDENVATGGLGLLIDGTRGLLDHFRDRGARERLYLVKEVGGIDVDLDSPQPAHAV